MAGVGWPDLRVRYHLIPRLDLELKGAAGSGEEAVGVRGYWNLEKVGIFDLMLGLDGGWLGFSGVDTLNGDGWYGEPFVGLQYTFQKHWTALVDIGPAWMSVSSEGYSLNEEQWVLNTALYYSFF